MDERSVPGLRLLTTLRPSAIARPRARSRVCVVKIESEGDIIIARRKGRLLAANLGFKSRDRTLIATAISELARNIIVHAKRGEIVLFKMGGESRAGVAVVGRDAGPGISDLIGAMRDGYSTSGGLGMGLPGVRRLADEFKIISEPGRGTAVTVKKWVR